MYKIIVIDDEQAALRDFELEIKGIDKLQLVGKFTSVKAASSFLLENGRVDLIFCDIRMPQQTGIEASRMLKHHCDAFVLITAYEDCALEAFRKQVHFCVIGKPVKRSAIEEQIVALEKLKKYLPVVDESRGSILLKHIIRQDSQILSEMVPLKKIQQVVIEKNNAIFIIQGYENRLTETITLTQLEEKFPQYFVKIRNNTLIGLRHIRQIQGFTVIMANADRFHVSERFKSRFRDVCRRYSLKGSL